MNFSSRLRNLHWTLILGLAFLALIRPIFSIIGLNDALGKPGTPLILTAAITLAWVLIVGLSRVRDPIITLTAAGLAYAVMTIVLSAILSPLLTGELQGPLAMPVAIIPLFIVNAIWGLFAGGLAALVQRSRGKRYRVNSTS